MAGHEMPNRRARLNGVAETMSPGAAAAFAELATQVTQLEGDYSDLKATIVGLDRKFSDSLTSIATRFETALAQVTTKLDERGKTQWPTLISFAGLIVLVMGALGGLAYSPIQSSMNRIEASLPSYLSIREASIIQARVDRDLSRIEAAQKEIVPRGEHDQKWRAYDQQAAYIQRQIDELNKRTGEVYTARDVIIDLQKRLDRVETKAH